VRNRAFIYLLALIVAAGLGIVLRFGNRESPATSRQAPGSGRAAARPRPDRTYDPTPDFARIDASPGPLYVFAHHTSAYYVIKKLQLEGRLPARGNVLINFDSHDDASVPFAVPSPEDRDRALAFLGDRALPLAEKLKRLRAFVRDDLNITAWVLPMAEDGSLAAYYYVLPKRWPLEAGTRRPGVVNLKRWAAGKEIVGAPKTPRIPKGFTLAVVRDDGLPSAQEMAGRSVIVTFDLDYFSNRDDLMANWHYNPDFEPKLPSTDEIRAAVASAVGNLKARHLRPKAFLIAESPGFTPRDQIRPIEEMLITQLKRAGFAQ